MTKENAKRLYKVRIFEMFLENYITNLRYDEVCFSRIRYRGEVNCTEKKEKAQVSADRLSNSKVTPTK
jgi:hypothetical protein